METTRSSSKGQMVIPKSVRDALNIRDGTELEIELLPENAFKVSVRRADCITPVRELAGALAGCGRRLTPAEERAAIQKTLLRADEKTRTAKRTRR